MIELYIDGQRATLPAETEINLEIISPVFNDLAEIGENFSYSIEIPAIAENAGILAMANRAEYDSAFPMTEHSAALYIDGVCWFSDGRAIVEDIAPEGVTVSLSWGLNSKLAELWDVKLSEVFADKTEAPDMHVSWSADSTYNSGAIATAGRWPYWGKELSGGKSANDIEHNLPIVSARFIFERLAEVGVSVDYSTLRALYFPLTSLNGSEYAANRGASISLRGYTVLTATPYAGATLSRMVRWDTPANDWDGLINGDGDNKILIQTPDGVLYFPQQTMRFVLSGEYLTSVAVEFRAYDVYNNVLGSRSVSFSPYNVSEWRKDVEPFAISYPNQAYVRTFVTQTVGNTNSGSWNQYLNIQAYTTLGAVYGAPYPLIPNLPDVTVGEFINTVAQLSGAYAYAKVGGIAFKPYAEALQGSAALNLSREYISDQPDGGRVRKSYINDEYAQINRVRYERANGVQTTADSAFNIANRMLQREADVVTVPFSPSDTWNAFAYLPLWDKDDKFQGFTPPPIIDDSERFGPELHWANILEVYYTEWRAVVSAWRVITVKMRLGAYFLASLDWSRAWYVSALGGRYLPVKISYNSDGISEVELLKL